MVSSETTLIVTIIILSLLIISLFLLISNTLEQFNKNQSKVNQTRGRNGGLKMGTDYKEFERNELRREHEAEEERRKMDLKMERRRMEEQQLDDDEDDECTIIDEQESIDKYNRTDHYEDESSYERRYYKNNDKHDRKSIHKRRSKRKETLNSASCELDQKEDDLVRKINDRLKRQKSKKLNPIRKKDSGDRSPKGQKNFWTMDVKDHDNKIKKPVLEVTNLLKDLASTECNECESDQEPINDGDDKICDSNEDKSDYKLESSSKIRPNFERTLTKWKSDNSNELVDNLKINSKKDQVCMDTIKNMNPLRLITSDNSKKRNEITKMLSRDDQPLKNTNYKQEEKKTCQKPDDQSISDDAKDDLFRCCKKRKSLIDSSSIRSFAERMPNIKSCDDYLDDDCSGKLLSRVKANECLIHKMVPQEDDKRCPKINKKSNSEYGIESGVLITKNNEEVYSTETTFTIPFNWAKNPVQVQLELPTI